jgi:hypothetical protein
MRNINKLKITVILAFLLISHLSAHVVLDYPTGGEIFSGGESITIKWHINIDHGENNWDIYFSNDGGVNWESIVHNLPKARNTYTWELPNISTTAAIIRVVQDNVGNDYDDQSSDFIINSELDIDELNDYSELPLVINNFPNPFNSSTIIKYQLPQSSKVKIVVYNLLGNEINKFVEGQKEAGIYTISWDGRNDKGSPVNGGIYYYQIQTDHYSQTNKMLFLK